MVILHVEGLSGGYAQPFNCKHGFTVVFVGTVDGVALLIYCRQVVCNAFVLSSFGPGRKPFLILFLNLHGFHFLETFLLSLPLFPGVGNPGVLGRVLDAHLLAPIHILFHYAKTGGAECNLFRVRYICDVVHRGRMDILLGASGAAVHKCEVSFIYARTGYFEELFGSVGDIGLGVIGRHVVGIGIDAEDGEVSGMAWPHPVVGFSAEFAD